jgi:protein N-terminal amidase
MIHSPYKFEAPWSAWEFAYHVLHKQANLVILSMAWLTRENPRSYSRSPKEPDMETLSYWLARIEPLIRAETEGEIIVVFANRTGTEEEAVYAGTSAVLGIQSGEVKVYGILGRGEKELLVVDTNKRPQAKLISEPGSIPLEARKGTSASKSDTNKVTKPAAISPPKPETQLVTVDENVTALSPVEPISHHAYFEPKGREAGDEVQCGSLKSSIGQSGFPNLPNSPTLKRPESPKSRNASRTRQPEQQVLPLVSHDLANEEKVIQMAVEMRVPPYSAPVAPDQRNGFANATVSPEDRGKLPRPKSAVW